jgi:putative ABC transport system substrate-binding protein
MRKELGILLVAFTCLKVAMGMSPSLAIAQQVDIAVLKGYEVDVYENALEGVTTTFKKNGYNVNWIYYNMEGDVTKGRQIAREIKSKRPGLVLTLGTAATKVAKEEIKDIPIIFAMVLDPVREGLLESTQGSGSNLAGVSLAIPVLPQFQTFKAFLPKLRKIGVIYNPAKSNLIIEKARLAAREINLELVLRPISPEEDITQVIKGFIGIVDGIWTPVDSSIFNTQSIEYLLLFSLNNNIPVMGFSPHLVKAGAVIGLYCDYRDTGRQAAEIGIRVLKGENPAKLPVVLPVRTKWAINQSIAKRMGIEPPADMLKEAESVF